MDYAALGMMLTGGAAGIWGLVVQFDARRKQSTVTAERQTVVMEGLDEFIASSDAVSKIPMKLEAAFEKALTRMEALNKANGMEQQIAAERFNEVSEAFMVQLGQLIAWKPPQIEFSPAQVEAMTMHLMHIGITLDRVPETLAAARTPKQEPLDLGRLEEKMERIAEQLGKLPPRLGGGGTVPPRARRLPAPRSLPPNGVYGTPSIPAPYVGGTIVVPPGEPLNLLHLVREQLQPNAPGSSVELKLTADDSVFMGAASVFGGPLSDTNYAYELIPGETRLYRSAFPGDNTPIGDLQVFATDTAVLHIEITT